MYEPEFNRLREEIERVTLQPGFDVIQTRAHQLQTRRRYRIAAALTGAAVIAGVAGVGVVFANRDGEPIAEETSRIPTYLHQALFAASIDQLYAYTERCRMTTCERWLTVTTDGGENWDSNPLPELDIRPSLGTDPSQNAYSLLVDYQPPTVVPLGDDHLLLSFSSSNGTSTPEAPDAHPDSDSEQALQASFPDLVAGVEWRYSSDNGETWQEVTVSDEPFDEVPEGSRLLACHEFFTSASCPLVSIDLATGVIAPLAYQPPLTDLSPSPYIPTSAGLWVAGTDPATQSPAIAVSHDRGRTWHTWTAPIGQNSENEAYRFSVGTHDGVTAYAVLVRADYPNWDVYPSHRLVALFHSDDGGATWSQLDSTVSENGESLGRPPIGVHEDGGMLIMNLTRYDSFFLSTDRGVTWERVDLRREVGTAALATYVTPVEGGFYTWDPTAFHISRDGLNWQRIPVPDPTD